MHGMTSIEKRVLELETLLELTKQNLEDLKHKVGAVAEEVARGDAGASPSGAIYLASVTTAITARSGDNPGTGQVQVRIYNGTNMLTAGPTVPVLNDIGTGVALNIRVKITWINGAYWLLTADCSGVA